MQQLAIISLLTIIVFAVLIYIIPALTMPHYDAFRYTPSFFSPDEKSKKTKGLIIADGRYSRRHADFRKDVQVLSDAVPRDDDVAFLQLCLRVLEQRYLYFPGQGSLFPWIVYRKNAPKVWQQVNGYQTCNVLAYLLGCMCYESGRFRKDDINIDYRYNEGSVHQFLVLHNVQPYNVTMDVDPWAHIVMNAPLGMKLSRLQKLEGTQYRSWFFNRSFEQCLRSVGKYNPSKCEAFTLRSQFN